MWRKENNINSESLRETFENHCVLNVGTVYRRISSIPVRNAIVRIVPQTLGYLSSIHGSMISSTDCLSVGQLKRQSI